MATNFYSTFQMEAPLRGYLSPIKTVSGHLASTQSISGSVSLGDVIIVEEPLPVFDGPYFIVPSEEVVLETEGCKMTSNVVIQAIDSLTESEIRTAVAAGWN